MMKNTITIFAKLALMSLILIGCTANSSETNEVNSSDDTQTTNTTTQEENTTSQTASTDSESNLTIVKAASTGDKYVDWGNKPAESEDEPDETWTWTHMMCDGPSYLDGKLKASSTLAAQGKKSYSADNICDDDPTTAWVEGNSDYGVGEYLELEWNPMGDGEISILNGYQASKTTWENNSRVKQMTVSVNGKDMCIIELADVMGVQKFKIPDLSTSPNNAIRFTITEVYPGLKYKDTAISGLFSCGG